MEHFDRLVESDRPVCSLIGKMEMEGALFSDVTRIARSMTKFSTSFSSFTALEQRGKLSTTLRPQVSDAALRGLALNKRRLGRMLKGNSLLD